MARGGGSAEAGVVYHLISRFIDKEWFIDSERARRMYLALLGTAIAASNWTCFSYAVMSNHVHLALLAGSDPLASWLRPMHQNFAGWINGRRDRIGGMFVKGPNFIEVPPDQYARVINYLHYNPVRARVVEEPGESDWTSHRAYIGASRAPGWLSVGAGMALARFAGRPEFERWSGRNLVTRESLVAGKAMPKEGRGRPPLEEPSPDQLGRVTETRAGTKMTRAS
jgi:REP element-mobilizing transposase RayT